jgi:hypothetical protein
MKRIFVAGPYSADNVIAMLDNISAGLRMSTRIMLAGGSPFCPFADFLMHLVLRDGESLGVNDYYAHSLEWLEVADAVMVLPGWEASKGTLAELDRARLLGIPVFYDFHSLKGIFMES